MPAIAPSHLRLDVILAFSCWQIRDPGRLTDTRSQSCAMFQQIFRYPEREWSLLAESPDLGRKGSGVICPLHVAIA
jgi:hypothetical protein